MPWAASLPMTFCQEKVTTSSLAQSSGWAKAAEVASQIVRPARSAGMKSPFGTLTPAAVPFQVKMTSLLKSIAPRSGNSPYGATTVNAFGIFSCSSVSVTQSLPKDSQARTSTPRWPSMVHMAISTAPVSEAGTMAMRKSAGTSSISRVRSIACLSLALLRPERCERPSAACSRTWTLQPGRFEQGPDEKRGLTGREPGF